MGIVLYLISFLASVGGSICGIGGGIIIKPVLDLFGVANPSVISFLSGCTVLAMSGYSVLRNMVDKERVVNMKTGTPLAVGAASGGIVGKLLFNIIMQQSSERLNITVIQSFCLGIITLVTLIYVLRKDKYRSYQVSKRLPCILIGIALGLISSFLGIGGGPFNLAILYLFFGMDTKSAVQNSLYIIMISQIASLLYSVFTGNIPSFDFVHLILMIFGGISGGIVGRVIHKRISSKAAEKLLISMMTLIILISCFNIFNR